LKNFLLLERGTEITDSAPVKKTVSRDLGPGVPKSGEVTYMPDGGGEQVVDELVYTVYTLDRPGSGDVPVIEVMGRKAGEGVDQIITELEPAEESLRDAWESAILGAENSSEDCPGRLPEQVGFIYRDPGLVRVGKGHYVPITQYASEFSRQDQIEVAGDYGEQSSLDDYRAAD
jgi:hypothetical protein